MSIRNVHPIRTGSMLLVISVSQGKRFQVLNDYFDPFLRYSLDAHHRISSLA